MGHGKTSLGVSVGTYHPSDAFVQTPRSQSTETCFSPPVKTFTETVCKQNYRNVLNGFLGWIQNYSLFLFSKYKPERILPAKKCQEHFSVLPL